MTVVWQEDFTGDKSQWGNRGGSNPGHDDCWAIRNGRGVFRIKGEPGSFRQANVGSKFSFVYGRVEARIRFMAPRIGAHGAMWIQDVVPNVPGGAEIDGPEHFGKDKVWFNAYWRDEINPWPADPYKVRKFVELDPQQWHVYSIVWTPLQYTFKVDGKIRKVIKQGLSDQPKQVVLSMLTDDWEHPTPPYKDYWKQVDWVRVTT